MAEKLILFMIKFPSLFLKINYSIIASQFIAFKFPSFFTPKQIEYKFSPAGSTTYGYSF